MYNKNIIDTHTNTHQNDELKFKSELLAFRFNYNSNIRKCAARENDNKMNNRCVKLLF